MQSSQIFSRGTLVSIGVQEWYIPDPEVGGYRCFDLVPFEGQSDVPFVEVGVIVESKKPKPIEPAMYDWAVQNKGYSGYPVTKQVEEDLYWVWDNGASEHMERAQRLYQYYKDRFDFYREVALEYHLLQHTKDLEYAKKNGWDSNLIKKPTAYRYYPIEN